MWFEWWAFEVWLEKSDIFLNCLWGNQVLPTRKYTHTFWLQSFFSIFRVLRTNVLGKLFVVFPIPIYCLSVCPLPSLLVHRPPLGFHTLKKIPMKSWILYGIWHWFIFLNERRWGEPKLFRKLSSKWAKELQLMTDLR